MQYKPKLYEITKVENGFIIETSHEDPAGSGKFETEKKFISASFTELTIFLAKELGETESGQENVLQLVNNNK